MNKTTKITIVKALGIIAIVSGHIGPIALATVLYLYHVPLFFFLSGYLYDEKYSHNIGQLFKKRIQTLYLPYLLYCLAFLFCRNLFLAIGIYSANPQALFTMPPFLPNPDGGRVLLKILGFQYFEPLLVPLWFLPCLIFVNILFAGIRKVALDVDKENAGRFTMFMVLFFAALGFLCAGLNIQSDLYLDCSLVALIFFFLGSLYRKHENVISLKASLAVPAVIGLVFCNRYHEADMFERAYGNPVLYVTCALAGIYINFWLADKLLTYQNKATELLLIIGRNTLPILALHLLAIKLVSFARIVMGDGDILSLVVVNPCEGFGITYYWLFIYTVVGVFVPIGFITALRAVRDYLSSILLHNRPTAAGK